ncbi:flagellar basal body L-ring protein FlgH [Thermomonas hydrothermalis]|uniref:Flagellar L-ring protein n=1 Tax=Thermomonas hydrothermalis TaxID=213588 RepID=A0A1M5A6I7_9GAMM|nr:flagellar basal body L-ring protein FlgH [Thermomonas hydrothermalis]SHF25880.1 flagellar L-ring protein precursor FlgH [Thermomonas hydrothermalis]
MFAAPVFRCFVWLAALPLLAGCATVNHLQGDVRPFPEVPVAATSSATTPVAAPAALPPGDSGGSIYAARSGKGLRLFEDNKASAVGDLLTIVLVENTTATTQAKTSVAKKNSNSLSVPVLGNATLPGLSASVKGDRSFDGNGNSAQSNSLAGQITVRVVEDLGNGNLLVRGDKQLRLNQGDELVQIQGIVRRADIGPDNRVTSDRVADARIVYGGRGTLARSNAMGWLARFFNSALYPF